MQGSGDDRAWLHAKALPKKIRLKGPFLVLTFAIWAALTGAVGYVAHVFEQESIARLQKSSSDRDMHSMLGRGKAEYDPFQVGIWVVLAGGVFYYLVPKLTKEIQRKVKGQDW